MLFDLIFLKKNLYSDRIPLLQLIKEKQYHGPAIEIGVARGEFSEMILKQTNCTPVYSVDIWRNFEFKHEQTKLRLKPFKERSIILKKTSEDGSKFFQKKYFDFIHIDANHSYKSVKQDLKLWWPLLKKNGLFSGHDYMPCGAKGEKFGVIEAVNEFCKEKNISINIVGKRWKSWYIIKNNE
jgi:hypothetical protein